jgi:hypothetical protein
VTTNRLQSTLPRLSPNVPADVFPVKIPLRLMKMKMMDLMMSTMKNNSKMNSMMSTMKKISKKINSMMWILKMNREGMTERMMKMEM